jgi:diadenosine tetraphosphate (Ap4A) HIT family hydrolase
MNQPDLTAAQDCRFCTSIAGRVIASNDLAVAIRDIFPATPFHSLVIPRRHVPDYFGLTAEEREACAELLQRLRDDIIKEDPTVEGFNVGTNVGAVAGQTIFHSHIHLIPRRKGDSPNPRGGVRLVVPGGHRLLDVCPFGKEGGKP